MAQVRTPPGGSNTPFGGVGLRRSNVVGPKTYGPSQRVGQVEDVPAGPADQNLTAERYDAAPEFYTHTLTVGAVTLTATRYDAAAEFYGHTLTQSGGGQNLTATRYDASPGFYSHTVSHGLTAARYDAAATFYAPTVSLALTATRYDAGASFYGASLSLGLVAARYDSAPEFYAATISVPSDQALTAARFDAEPQFFGGSADSGGQIYWGWWWRRRKELEQAEPELAPILEEVREVVAERKPDPQALAKRAIEIARLADQIRQAQERQRNEQRQQALRDAQSAALVAAEAARQRLEVLLEAEQELLMLLDLAQAEWEQAKRQAEEADIAFVMALLAD